jgi:hypothetical protein
MNELIYIILLYTGGVLVTGGILLLLYKLDWYVPDYYQDLGFISLFWPGVMLMALPYAVYTLICYMADKIAHSRRRPYKK